MKLDPNTIQEGESVFDAYPILKSYKECKQYVGALEPAKLLLYVLYAYSKDSEYAGERDLVKLKEQSASKVGWKKQKGKWPESVQRIMDGKEPVVNKMIYIVFRLQKDLEYAGYKADVEAYWQLLRELQTPLNEDADDDKKLKSTELKLRLSEGKKTLLQSINDAHEKLFNGDKELEETVRDNDLEDSEFGESVAEQMAREAREGKL
jgi:hypothetical protein